MVQETSVPEVRYDEDGDRQVEATGAEARQGAGPRAMVSVLTVSLLLAAIAGSALLLYFYLA